MSRLTHGACVLAAAGFTALVAVPPTARQAEPAAVADVAPRSQAAGSIAGRVTDSTGAPIPNAFVRAEEAGPPDANRDSRFAAGARTDERGVYEISPVLPETYTVFVEVHHTTHPADLAPRLPSPVRPPYRAAPPPAVRFTSEDGGFYSPVDTLGVSVASPAAADGRETVFVTTAYPRATDLAQATPVTIGPEQHRTDVDVTMVSVPRVRVRGVVISPVELLVRRHVLRLRDPGSRRLGPVALTRASRDGTFEFLSAPPGNWILEAFREVSDSDVAHPDPLGLTAQRPLLVGDDDIEGLEVRLRPGVTVSTRLEFDGTPPDADPRPPFVRLEPIEYSLANGEWTTTPDRFVASGVGPGAYRLVVRIPGWRIAALTRGGRDITGEPIEISASDVADLVLSLTSSPTEITGSVRRPTDAALAGTSVAVFPVDRGRFSAATRDAMPVRSNGTFRFGDVIPGEYHVIAVPESMLDDWPSAVLLDRLSVWARRVSVRRGEYAKVQLEVVRR
jgi:hypothetical protein